MDHQPQGSKILRIRFAQEEYLMDVLVCQGDCCFSLDGKTWFDLEQIVDQLASQFVSKLKERLLLAILQGAQISPRKL